MSPPDTLLHLMDGNHPELPAPTTAVIDTPAAKKLFGKLQRHEAPQPDDAAAART